MNSREAERERQFEELREARWARRAAAIKEIREIGRRHLEMQREFAERKAREATKRVPQYFPEHDTHFMVEEVDEEVAVFLRLLSGDSLDKHVAIAGLYVLKQGSRSDRKLFTTIMEAHDAQSNN